MLPTCTLPKLRVEGDEPSDSVAAVPLPVSEMVICAGDPLVDSTMEPVDDVAEVGVNTALKFSDAPAAMVLEVLIPETLKPVPLAVTWEKVRVVLPVFFSVITSELLLPTATLPKATLAGLAAPRASSPVPLRAIVAGDPGALLVMEIVPDAVPSALGAKLTENVAFAPALMVVGASVMVYPGPEIVAALTFSAALPVFVNVTICEALLPTLTLPNDTDAGLMESCAWVAVPEPFRAIFSGDPGALLVTETFPLALPDAVGAKVTVNEVVPPGLKVPAVNPPSEKLVPETLAAETDTAAVPEFVSVTFVEPLLPTRTLPKLTLAGLAESAPCVPVPLRAMERVGSDAFVEIVMLPEALPAAVGAKVAVKDA